MTDRVKRALEALFDLKDRIDDLHFREEREFAKELVKIWQQGMYNEDHGYPDSTMKVAGVARRIADEWDLPGEFK